VGEDRPLHVIHRQTLHMVAENAEEIAVAVGLPPISEEVAGAERQDAQKRLECIAMVKPAINDQAAFLSAMYTRIQRDQAAAGGMPVHDIDWQPVQEFNFHMLNTSGMALVALLVDLGVLHLDADWVPPSEQAQEQP
jgi:hypothetical protein